MTMEDVSRKDIETSYLYLVENKNKIDEKEFIKLRDSLKNSLIELYVQGKVSEHFFNSYTQKIKDLEKKEVIKDEDILFERCPLCGKETGARVIRIESEKDIFITKVKEVKYVCASCGSVWKGKKGSYWLVKTNYPTMYGGKALSLPDWKSVGKTGFSRYHLLLKELAEGNFRRLRKLNQSEVPMILQRDEIALYYEKNCVLYEPEEKVEYQESFAGLIPGWENLRFLLGGSRGSIKSYTEIEEIDEGTLILTNWRLVLMGKKETYTIFPRHIVRVEIFKDSIMVHESYGAPKSFCVYNPEILGNALIGVSKIVPGEEHKEKNKESTVSEIETPEERDLDQLDKIKKIIKYYNKNGYKVLGYNFKDPILKATISKDNKTYLAVIDIETKDVEYVAVKEEKQEE
ncbi:MAG: hypothetical protein KAT49_01745 [Methanomicrobia archaeon]|nr:hypothetical protein [Methanomicrobia archaeon]